MKHQPNPKLPPEGAPFHYACLAALIALATRRIQQRNMAKGTPK